MKLIIFHAALTIIFRWKSNKFIFKICFQKTGTTWVTPSSRYFIQFQLDISLNLLFRRRVLVIMLNLKYVPRETIQFSVYCAKTSHFCLFPSHTVNCVFPFSCDCYFITSMDFCFLLLFKAWPILYKQTSFEWVRWIISNINIFLICHHESKGDSWSHFQYLLIFVWLEIFSSSDQIGSFSLYKLKLFTLKLDARRDVFVFSGWRLGSSQWSRALLSSYSQKHCHPESPLY